MDKIRKLDLEERPRRRRSFFNRLRGGHGAAPIKKKQSKKPFLIALLIIVAILGWLFFSTSSSIVRYALNIGGYPFKQTDGRVNILLLGIGGGNHDGPDLTDSIILASYNLKTNEVSMFSIPRDLWLPSINEKINTAYTIGLSKGGNGLGYTENAVSSVVGAPVHYAVVLDFSGFSKAVDLVGGVDINVSDSFDDYEYPIDGKENDLCGWKEQQMDINADQAKALNVNPGFLKVYIDPTGKVATDSASLDFSCRYEHIHFDKGWTHMDGTTALKFVRSRHAIGVEGSDFARSRRQQLVIEAFKQKAFSVQTLANPAKVAGLVGTFGDSLRTDIPASNYLDFYSLAKKSKVTNSVVLGDLGNGESILYNPPLSSNYGGAWVLVPKNKDYNLIAEFIKQTLNPTPAPSASLKASPKISQQ